MMTYRRRASPKHYDDMTEVCIVEGAPHTAKRRLGVPLWCPPPTYIKGGGEVADPRGGAMGGSPTLSDHGFRQNP